MARVSPGIENEPSDEQLLSRIGSRDFPAFEQLYKRYYEYLYRFIYRTIRRADLVEEVINDTMMVVWNKAATLELTVRPSTWILAVAYKKSLKALSGVRGYRDDVPLADVPEHWICDSADHCSEVETANWVETAFDLLSAEQRAVMELVYYHGLHYTEIAAAVGCPENTVKTRIFHARKKLKAAMPALGGE